MSGHTPGPWSFKCALPGHDRDFGITAPNCANVIAEAFEEFVAKGDRRPQEAEANARLISAAPELLDACRTALRASENDGLVDEETLRFVIAKAEGM